VTDLVLEMFAGPGGVAEGLRSIGVDAVGFENDRAACATRAAAGHRTIRADLSTYPFEHLAKKVTGIWASPPCTDFSAAGVQVGRTGKTGQLIDLVPEWVETMRPEWLVCEQVPPCLPIWQEHAHGYRELGYSTWVGVINAANLGVPQTRKRAFLIASLRGPALPPEPTHARQPEASLFGDSERPWVTMAEALGWGPGQPAWVYARPSTTIVGSFSPETVAAPGYRRPGDPPRQDTPDSVTITLAEALVLQGFDAGYPVDGAKTKKWEQVGNAVPPPLAAAVVGALLS
jgi:DNA (cytosine-5)-methyltransferase 1